MDLMDTKENTQVQERKEKKHRRIRQGICLGFLLIFFGITLWNRGLFSGTISVREKIDKSIKKEQITDGWEKTFSFKAQKQQFKYFEISIRNFGGAAAQGYFDCSLIGEDGKKAWNGKVYASTFHIAKYAKGVSGTIFWVDKKLHAGETYQLKLKAVGCVPQNRISFKRALITTYYYGFNYKNFMMLMAGFVLAVAVLFLPNPLNDRWNAWLSRALFAATPVLAFHLVERFNQIKIKAIESEFQQYNLLVYVAVLLVIYALVNRVRLASVLTVLSTSALALANYFVTAFRGTPLMPVDFLSAKTAANVASGYQFSINTAILWNILIIFLFCFVWLWLRPSQGWKFKFRLIPIAAAMIPVFSCIYMLGSTEQLEKHDIEVKVFNPGVSCRQYGYATIFASSVRFLVVDKPDDYSAVRAEKILEPYEKKAELYNNKIEKIKSKKKVNVIVIMNEALSDLSVLGDFKTNEDYMPFLHSLKENTVKGMLHMSSYGGQTANSEFEFLTNSSMAFLPAGTVAYEYQVKDQLGGLTTTLKAQDYQGNMAFHPFIGSGYNRDAVYPLLGFQSFITQDQMVNPEKFSWRVTDKADYQKLISEYEKAKESSSAPFYMFNVTLQNHGGYAQAFSNLNEEIKFTDGTESTSAARYLSLVKKSDEAFQQLVSYFKKQKEPTVIVMFGDHQPKLSKVFYKKVMGRDAAGDTVEADDKKQQVPFLIWTNYAIKKQEYEQMSPNYLSLKLMDLIDSKETPYEAYLKDLYKKYPVVTSHMYMDSTGKMFNSEDLDSMPKALKEYQMVQYYHLFAKDKRKDQLFFLK